LNREGFENTNLARLVLGFGNCDLGVWTLDVYRMCGGPEECVVDPRGPPQVNYIEYKNKKRRGSARWLFPVWTLDVHINNTIF